MRPNPMKWSQQAVDYQVEDAEDLSAVDVSRAERALGQLMREARVLNEEQVDRVLSYQRQSGLRFGEAAVALRFVHRKDVLDALSRQFHYTTGVTALEGNSELVAASDPFSDQADAFRELRSRLLLEVLGERTRAAICVLSPDVGDGKSYLAANLAVSFSQLGNRTLLIDADLRSPRQDRLLRVTAGMGLSSVLAGFADSGAPLYDVPGLPSLHLMPAGAVPPNPLELLQRPVFPSLLRDMLQQFAHVIIDTSAAARGADARVVAARCGASIVVARKGRTSLQALEGLLASLTRGPAKVAGVVMNEH
jgi:protein-tyrosine kinase